MDNPRLPVYDTGDGPRPPSWEQATALRDAMAAGATQLVSAAATGMVNAAQPLAVGAQRLQTRARQVAGGIRGSMQRAAGQLYTVAADAANVPRTTLSYGANVLNLTGGHLLTAVNATCWWCACAYQNAEPNAPLGAPETIVGACDSQIGDTISSPDSSINYILVAGPFPDPVAAGAACQALPASTCQPIQAGQWYVCCGQQIRTEPPPDCTWHIEATLSWDTIRDYDLYMDGPGGVCYYDRLQAGPLRLNHDALPVCVGAPPPEQITGTFTGAASLRTWWNDYDPACGQPSPTITATLFIINDGPADVKVTPQGAQSQTFGPGRHFLITIPEDPAHGNQSAYAGGYAFDVECVAGSSSVPPPAAAATAPIQGASVCQSPGPGQQIIAGPFPSQQQAQDWINTHTAEIAQLCQGPPPPPTRYSCVNGQCVPDPNGQYPDLTTCQAACATTTPPPPPCCPTCGNQTCNCPAPVVNVPACPPPVVNVNVQGGNTYNTSTVNNITNTTNNIRETINNIRSTVNNSRTTITNNTRRTINNYLDEIDNSVRIIDSYNVSNVNQADGQAGALAGRRTIYSDGSWTYETVPGDGVDVSYMDQALRDIAATWDEDTAEDAGPQAMQPVAVPNVTDPLDV